MTPVTSGMFEWIADMIRRMAGIVIIPEKAYLLETRLLPVMRRHGIVTMEELITQLKKLEPLGLVWDKPNLLYEAVEAVTINETSFFRDHKLFQHLRQMMLPMLLAESVPATRPLRFWSAACSTGQEAYSLAISLLEESMLLRGREIDIVATDISRLVLEKARSGEYSQFEVQRGLPIALLLKYFEQKADRWVVRPEVKARIDFRIANLMQDSKVIGRFDVIFCRNVMMYFEQETKQQLLERMMQSLRPGGYLVIGSSETIRDVSVPYVAVEGCAGVYQLQL